MEAEPKERVEIVWGAQPGPQRALLRCRVPEIFFGGARGGGKTDGILGKWAYKALRLGAKFNAVFFRKEMPQQDDLIERSKQIYGKIGAEWRDHHKIWHFPGGARIRFRPLENVADAEKYQGQNISDACVEEAGNYATSDPIDRLFGCLRGNDEVQLILTANPGGPGHGWIKARYIDPAPSGMEILTRDLANGAKHKYVYIPSKVENNRILLDHDPQYINRLHLVGSRELVKAWLEGDWNVVQGAFFDQWQTRKHVIEPFTIPEQWVRIRSMDWGYAKPFSVGWWAVVADNYESANGSILPRGCLVRYREWYGATGPNVGLRLDAEDVAQGIAFRDCGEKIDAAVLDPSAFAMNGGPSIAERMATSHKVRFRPADNTRVPQRGSMSGWDAMRARLAGDEDGPMLVTFSTCKDFIRTIPVLQHDPLRAEDLDTDGEDHVADETRYACLSRPWIRAVKPAPQPIRGMEAVTLNDMWKHQRSKERRI